MVVITINSSDSWFCPNWAFRSLVGAIRPHLPIEEASHSQLSQALENAGRIGLLDVKSFSLEEFQLLTECLRKARADFVTAGAESWRGPEYFQPFVDSLDELIRLCEKDARNN